MAVFSFYCEKGGSGKSLHSLLFGSYLAYARGARVCLLDFEFKPRLEKTRNDEDVYLADANSVLSRYLSQHPQEGGVLDIQNVPKEVLVRGERSLQDYMGVIRGFIRSVAERYEYVILDLPAEFNGESVSFLGLSGCADLVAVPFDYTPTVSRCAYNTAYALRGSGVPLVMFWNKVSVSDLKRDGFLDKLELFFINKGFDVLPHRVKYFQKAMRESEGRGFVVSSYCWPRRYVEMSCPVLELLYADLKERLDSIVEESL